MDEINEKLARFKDRNGAFHILAFDHRGSFKKMMQEGAGEGSVSDEEVRALKKVIIAPVLGSITGLLIDQDYGLPAYRELDASAPFLLPTEKTGYVDTAGERVTELQYSGASITADGGQAMKILIYANNNVPTWETQLATCKQAYDDAHANGLPLFLEFVLYEANGIASGPIAGVLEDAISKGVSADVWKLPYPGSPEACDAVTSIAGATPWVLLTGGVDFEGFAKQYEEAKSHGASGFVAGRALWQEACALWKQPKELEQFLTSTLPERFAALSR